MVKFESQILKLPVGNRCDEDSDLSEVDSDPEDDVPLASLLTHKRMIYSLVHVGIRTVTQYCQCHHETN